MRLITFFWDLKKKKKVLAVDFHLVKMVFFFLPIKKRGGKKNLTNFNILNRAKKEKKKE